EHRRCFATQQMPGAGPIDKAYGELKRTCPVRTTGIGTLLQPGRQQATRGAGKPRLAREMPCLRQSDEFEVAVQLPEILDVADDALVSGIDVLAEIKRRLHASLVIAVPARREAKAAIPQRENVPSSGKCALGSLDIGRGK